MPQLNFLTAFILLVIGIVLLCKSADILVDGAVAIAGYLNISPLIVGLTIVSFGTSAPEVAASVAATLDGNGHIAIGNVFGSNIANLALIGGVCAILSSISVNVRLLKVELPVMALSMFVLLPIMLNDYVSRFEGIILLLIFSALLIALIKHSHSKEIKSLIKVDKVQDTRQHKYTKSISVLMVAGGLIGLSIAAKITLKSAIFIGSQIGMSEAVIGLTIVAVGTSLPELITSLIASLKKQDDISVGNLVGSNIFNTLLVIGSAAVVKPMGMSKIMLKRDYTAMIIISAIFFLLSFQSRKLARFAGFVLLGTYVAYTVILLSTDI